MLFNKESVSDDELKLAFKKLQAYSYFDNYDLILRGKIAKYKHNLDTNLTSFIRQVNSGAPFESEFENSVGVTFLPKKVVCQPPNLPGSFYTNARILTETEIKKPLAFCDLPVNFHLISVIWLMRYGPKLESSLSANVFGNRLVINEEAQEVATGRALFKPYVRQFQNWWAQAIKSTKDLLDKGTDATIINFDLQSFYHEAKFQFNKLEEAFPEMVGDVIHVLLVKIHQEYRTVISRYNKRMSTGMDSEYPLPIGLLSSHVIANWYLADLDSIIDQTLRPISYGRYVDDILIVIKNTLLKTDEIRSPEGPLSKEHPKLIKYYLRKYLKELFIIADDTNEINLLPLSYRNLRLNQDKIFIYQFDAKYSPNLVEKFIDEQKERASMFRFLSDEEDEYFDDFEKLTFESNFDHIDANSARFKNIEDNKYKLSAFLSKIIKRRILKGKGYREEEVDKISKYFRGAYLIKHYYFWEKLFTLFVVYDRKDKFKKLVDEIGKEIDLTKVPTDATDGHDFVVSEVDYRKSLREFFKLAVSMAVGLNPSFLLRKPLLSSIFKYIEIRPSSQKDIEIATNDYRLFRESGLLRGAFVYYNLLQFTRLALTSDVDLTKQESFFNSIRNHDDDLGIPGANREFIPMRVKFWQVALWVYYRNVIIQKPSVSTNTNLWHNDRYASGVLLDEAFDIFAEINSIFGDRVKDRYFRKGYDSNLADKRYADSEQRTPSDRAKNYFIQELFLENGGNAKEKVRVCIVNKYVNFHEYEQSLKGSPVVDPKIQDIFDRILDEVSTIENCDLFVMPELCLPHRFIHRYTEQSEKKQIGFSSGIEHVNLHNTGFNFVLTVLPISVDGDKDAIPILRLKNHYAPDEEVWIRGKKMIVPKPNPYRYDLFVWRGFYFATYYCFELADVFHRSALFSRVDSILAPVWNSDTHYYNSVIDSATRDMHNYLVLVNTAQYGFSKIARPRDHVNREKIVVKGGTEVGYPYTLLVGDLRIKELRDFQLLDFSAQKDLNKDKKSFKPTPPDFPIENVRKRIENKSFFNSDSSDNDVDDKSKPPF